MTRDFIEQAHRGDLDGMNFAGLVRLSVLVRTDRDDSDSRPEPFSGRDILSTDEQIKDCRNYTARRNGSYVYTYEEPDTSAFKRKRVRLPDGRIVYRVIRPIYENALDDLKRGITPDGQRLDGLIVYDIDRLTRDNRHLEDAIEVVQHFHRPIIDPTGTLDLLTDNGRTVARIIVAASNKQSADTARRVTRKHRAMEQAGIPTGGIRPFGWQKDKRSLNAVEADAIREGAKRLLEGAPLAAIGQRWNQLGLLTPFGNNWITHTVKNVYRNPRLCGYRSRNVRGIKEETGTEFVHVEIVRDANGEPVAGQWEAILSVAEWEAVVAIIGTGPEHTGANNARKYLLTGIMRCGKCGAKMRCSYKYGRNKHLYYYMCPSKARGGCGGTSVPGAQVDEFLTEAVIQKFELEAKRRSAEAAPKAWSGEEALNAVREQIEELTTAWKSRQIKGERYFHLLAGLEEEETALIASRREWLASSARTANRPLTIRKNWESGILTLAEKRAYIDQTLRAVVVQPAGGRRKWNPDRLQPVWVEG